MLPENDNNSFGGLDNFYNDNNNLDINNTYNNLDNNYTSYSDLEAMFNNQDNTSYFGNQESYSASSQEEALRNFIKSKQNQVQDDYNNSDLFMNMDNQNAYNSSNNDDLQAFLNSVNTQDSSQEVEDLQAFLNSVNTQDSSQEAEDLQAFLNSVNTQDNSQEAEDLQEFLNSVNTQDNIQSSDNDLEAFLNTINTENNSQEADDLQAFLNSVEVQNSDNSQVEELNEFLKDMEMNEDSENHFSTQEELTSYISNEEDIDLEENDIKEEPDMQNILENLYEDDLPVENKKEDNKEKRKGFFANIISKIKHKKTDEDSQESYNYEESKFKEYVFLLDDEEDDTDVLRAVEICDDSLKLDRHKVFLDKKLKEYDIALEDIKCYENLSDEEAQNLKDLLEKYIHLNNERRSIRYQMSDFSSSINKLEFLKEDAEKSMAQIENAEKRKRLLTRDIQIIRDEKERTMTDRNRMQIAYKILYKFSFLISIVLGLAIMFLTLLSVSTNQSVFLPLSILCITLVFTVVIIYALRKKLVFELKLNEKKYAKLVTLLNKKTVVVSHYINFLNFVYKKYNVRNSRQLKSNLSDFTNYKHILTRYDNLGKLVFEVQKQLESFLLEKKIYIKNTSLEAFAKSINIDNKILYFREMSNKKQNVITRLEEIEEEQKVLMNELNEISERDETKEQVVEKIIKAYVNETQKILSEEDEEEIEKLNENL